MKVSLNTIKQFTDIDLSVDELVAKINSQLGSVEDVIDLSDVYKDAIIVKIVSCEKHPAADRLNICMVDDGGVRENVERNDHGLVQVVCGAPNVHADMFAVWLPPQSIVPSSYHDSNQFVLGARELRGIVSQGMLAAADELGIGNDHDGILAINPEEWKPSDLAVAPGASFAACYGLDDTTIDIENKMFTHRPDLFGQLGVAREIAGIQQQQFTSPNWYAANPEFTDASGLDLTVFNETAGKVPRFTAIAMQNVEVKPSPLWLQAALVTMGVKPISNIVDVTNYIMLLTAQPTHAYDYDKIRGATIGARLAKDGETVKLLNGKSYDLTSDDIVIADAEGPIGLGGIMGGGNSEVSAETKNIVLEVANFDMYTVRKSSMRHGVFTDALTRFNKGQSPLQNGVIMSLLMKSVFDVAGGEQASKLHDDARGETAPRTTIVSSRFINERLGLELTDDEIIQLLQHVEISTQQVGDELEITAPFWRTDIELPEDIVEEVGRLYGFENLPSELPQRALATASTNTSVELKSAVRQKLSQLGMNEVLTYSFVHEKTLQKAGQNPDVAYRLANALSPDLQYYRLSLTPSLLDKVHMNVKNRFNTFGLFEFGRAHFVDQMESSEPTVPCEWHQLAAIITASDKTKPEGSAYYLAKRYLEHVVGGVHVNIQAMTEADLSGDDVTTQLVAPYAPKRSALVHLDGVVCGVVGEFKAEVSRAFKLPAYTAGFEVRHEVLLGNAKKYEVLSRFPSVTQDISIDIDEHHSVGSVLEVATGSLHELDMSWKSDLSVVSIYQIADTTTKSITLRLTIANHERSLTDSEVSSILEGIATAVTSSLPPRL